MRSSTIQKSLWAAAIVASIAAAVFMIWFFANLDSSINDGYALWGAADMVIDYMDEHEGRWPRNWEDLEPYFRRSNGRVGGWSFEKFQSRVVIDFAADVSELRKASLNSSAAFRVIRAINWGAAHVGQDPNERLREYFRGRVGKK